MTVNPQYKYLGLTIRSSGKVDFEGLCSKSLKASFLMRKKKNTQKKQSFEEMNGQLGIKLFDSLLRPILCYGCEVWGPTCYESA